MELQVSRALHRILSYSDIPTRSVLMLSLKLRIYFQSVLVPSDIPTYNFFPINSETDSQYLGLFKCPAIPGKVILKVFFNRPETL
jgi:hypothetical protein